MTYLHRFFRTIDGVLGMVRSIPFQDIENDMLELQFIGAPKCSGLTMSRPDSWDGREDHNRRSPRGSGRPRRRQAGGRR